MTAQGIGVIRVDCAPPRSERRADCLTDDARYDQETRGQPSAGNGWMNRYALIILLQVCRLVRQSGDVGVECDAPDVIADPGSHRPEAGADRCWLCLEFGGGESLAQRVELEGHHLRAPMSARPIWAVGASYDLTAAVLTWGPASR